MKKTLVGLAMIGAVALGAAGWHAGGVENDEWYGLEPCVTEDSDNCYWDAELRGNGKGWSFYVIDGQITYVDHDGYEIEADWWDEIEG